MLDKSFIHINGNLCYINYFIYFIRSLRAHLLEGVGCTPSAPRCEMRLFDWQVDNGMVEKRWEYLPPWPLKKACRWISSDHHGEDYFKRDVIFTQPHVKPTEGQSHFFCFNFFSFQEVMTQTIPLSYRGDRWTIPHRVTALWQVITLQYLKSSVFHVLFTVTLLKGEIFFFFFLLQGTIGGQLVVQYWQYINFTLLIKIHSWWKKQQQHIYNDLTILEIIWLFVIDPLTQHELKLNTGHTSDTHIWQFRCKHNINKYYNCICTKLRKCTRKINYTLVRICKSCYE